MALQHLGRVRPPGSGLEFAPLRATNLSEFAHPTLILERNGLVADTLTGQGFRESRSLASDLALAWPLPKMENPTTGWKT